MTKHVAIVNFNTPRLVNCAIQSVRLHTPGCFFHIFDNSDRYPFTTLDADIEYIDNTRGQIVNWREWLQGFPEREPEPTNNYGSAKHTYTIQWLIDHIGEPLVLLDSDALLHTDIAPLYNTDVAFAAELRTNRGFWGADVVRASPILCYLNVPMLREHGITYFNPRKMWALVKDKPASRYDTGAWLFEQVESAHLPYITFALSDYAEHLGHGSWRTRPAQQWLLKHKSLWSVE